MTDKFCQAKQTRSSRWTIDQSARHSQAKLLLVIATESQRFF